MVERTIEIDAPIERVFEVISNIEDYPDFISTTDAVDVRRNGDEADVEFEINVIKPIRYTLHFKFNGPEEMTWTFVRGDFMKENKGGWELTRLSEDKTKARYYLDVRFGWMVPKGIVEKLTETQLPELLDSFKRRAEGAV